MQEPRELAANVAQIADDIAGYSGLPDRASATIRTGIASFEASSWPEVAWRFSSLNEDGCPIEFAFSSDDNALRYTTEVAAPEVDAHARLAVAGRLIAELQPGVLIPQVLELWRPLQSGCGLRWGCWLGVREDAAGQRLKLYVEMPRSAAQKPHIAQPLLPGSELLMIGQDLSSHRIEYYFRQPEVSASEADFLLNCLGNTEQGRTLLSAFAELCEMPAAAALRWIPFGYSLSLGWSDNPQYSLFIRSRTLGKLDRTRQQFVAYERSSKRGSCYQSLLGDIPQGELPDHGMLSLTTYEHGIAMRVSLSACALARVRFRSPEARGAFTG